MPKYTADIGCWEKGKTIDLRAKKRESALHEAFERAPEAQHLMRNGDTSDCVQLYEDGRIIWDQCLVPGMWRA